jgi:hypothetical protein
MMISRQEGGKFQSDLHPTAPRMPVEGRIPSSLRQVFLASENSDSLEEEEEEEDSLPQEWKEEEEEREVERRQKGVYTNQG